jgi:gas vesicle protein
MSDGYDRFDTEGGGGSFVMGLLTGTVLGAGLGMLFAPKSGSDLRNQISEQAGNLANTASEGYRRVSGVAGDLVGRSREVYDKARETVVRGADQAQRYVRDATSGFTTPTVSTGAESSGIPPSSGSRIVGAESGRGTAPDTSSSAIQSGGPRSGGGSRRN